MSHWACGVAGCGANFGAVDDLLRHQVTEHGHCTCAVCGERYPEGFLAIRHAFSAHTRAEYVRAYDASADDIRLRERIKSAIEEEIDVPALLAELGVDSDEAAVSAGD